MGEETFVPSPPRVAVQTLQKIVAGYALMPDEPEVLETALFAIRDAIDTLNGRNWNFCLNFTDIDTQSDLQDYPVPNNFKAPRRLLLLDPSDLSVARLDFKPWTIFLDEHQRQWQSGSPCVYSCAPTETFGTISLDMMPSVQWVASYPKMRLWYFRNVQYNEDPGATQEFPSRFNPFIRSHAEAMIADRYAVGKASAAYARAEAYWNRLIADDGELYPDWEQA